jgi:hypothetical protein
MPAKQVNEHSWELDEDTWGKELMPIPDLFNGGREGWNFETDKGCLLDYTCPNVIAFLDSIDPGHIWTLTDGDGEETYTGDDGLERPYMYISNGMHVVNRLGYFVTCLSVEEYLGEEFKDHNIIVKVEV